MTQPPDFDRIARPYRWLEYLTFGPALQRCRTHFLPELATSHSALVLGDGDGRFLAALLAANPALHADAVDTSRAMLHLLTQRARTVHPTAVARLTTHVADARSFAPTRTYDLVATHFFLDCLTQPELETLLARILPSLQPGAHWVVSDFCIPAGPLRRPASILVRALYLAFRILTGLRTTHLPDHAAALTAAGFTRSAQQLSLAGLLTSEIWERPSPAQP